MADAIQSFRVVAWWSAGRTGLAKSNSAPNAIHFTAPTQFGGVEGRWTPEDLLLCAIASCYTTTFRALADNSKFEYVDFGVEVEGAVSKAELGYALGDVVIRPILTISSEDRRERGLRLLQKTKTVCLVSRALSVEQKLEPQLQVGESRVPSRQG